MGMENGLFIEWKFENVQYWYDCGICYIIFMYSKDNYICDFFYDIIGIWNGFSFFG